MLEIQAKNAGHSPHNDRTIAHIKSERKQAFSEMNSGLTKVKNFLPAADSTKVQNAGKLVSIGVDFQKACRNVVGIPVNTFTADDKDKLLNLVVEGMKMLVPYMEANF